MLLLYYYYKYYLIAVALFSILDYVYNTFQIHLETLFTHTHPRVSYAHTELIHIHIRARVISNRNACYQVQPKIQI